MPSFSSKQYEWNDISVNILGRTIRGLVAVSYAIKQEKSELYGRGSKPLAIQSGNKSFSGDIELLQSEFDALLAVVKAKNPNGHLTDVSFDAVWSFSIGTTIQTRIIKGVEVEDYENSMKQGDKNMTVKLKYKALDVVEVA